MDCGNTRPADLLILLLLLSGASCSEVLLEPMIEAVLGRDITLPCRFLGNGKVTQVTWDKMTDMGPQMVAVRSKDHGIRTHDFYGHRACFQVTASDPNASLVIRDVISADGGRYRCSIVTFPSGNFEKETLLTVMVPPKTSIVPGERDLLEGDRRALAATCIAKRSSPPATISWDSEVSGEHEETSTKNVDDTLTIVSHYYLDPVRAMEGHKISCLVSHYTFAKPARLEHKLSVYFVPEVTIGKSSEDWHEGMGKAELTCHENGNPAANDFSWRRMEGSLPNNSVPQGNKLMFHSPLSINDAGTYVCEATNKIGSRTAQVSIKITDSKESSVNMLSMAFIAIAAVGVLLLVTLVVAVVAVNHYHKKKTQEMVFKLEEISTMSRQPSIRRCNSMSASVDARLQDGGGSRENVLEQEPILQEAAAMRMQQHQQQQLRNSSRDLQNASEELMLPPAAFGSHRYSLRSTTSDNPLTATYQLGQFRYSLNNNLRYSWRERMVGSAQRTYPPPIPLGNHRNSTRDMTGTPDQVEVLPSQNLTPSPSVPESQTDDEEEVIERVQSIHAAMGHFYPHNGTLRAKPTGNGIYIARREHCV
ncbi:nectin-4-like [Scyliorhinus canicula]|uniref:nectin-4-like n=1 Tax=Scyliorhinus canicula TaxID=7830 RepID=UPI0018F55E03|nr:nectin-4-like [Scyliorhinus canicula]